MEAVNAGLHLQILFVKINYVIMNIYANTIRGNNYKKGKLNKNKVAIRTEKMLSLWNKKKDIGWKKRIYNLN